MFSPLYFSEGMAAADRTENQQQIHEERVSTLGQTRSCCCHHEETCRSDGGNEGDVRNVDSETIISITTYTCLNHSKYVVLHLPIS